MKDKNFATLAELREAPEEWLRVSEVADRLGIHPDTVRRWESSGHLKCKRHPVNNYRLFLLKELIRTEAENEEESSNLR